MKTTITGVKAYFEWLYGRPHASTVKHILPKFAKMQYVQIVVLCLVSHGLLNTAAAATCDMAESFKQVDRNAKNGRTAVWASQEGSSLLFLNSLNVNTDGTRRSYSVEDFWGEKIALNNMCNAMRDGCAGLSKDALRKRRLITQQASKKGWPSSQLKKTNISPAIVPFKDGKPCPTVDGFLVSATALHRPKITNVCDVDNYVDALKTSAIVLPKRQDGNTQSEFTKKNANVGDLVVAMVPNSKDPVYAVVGDTGPSDKLGEGSIALNGKLLGRNQEPMNYREVLGRGEYKGKEWVVSKAIVLIFPNTRDLTNPYLTQERIDEMGKKHFEQWGGIERMNACAGAYGSK